MFTHVRYLGRQTQINQDETNRRLCNSQETVVFPCDRKPPENMTLINKDPLDAGSTVGVEASYQYEDAILLTAPLVFPRVRLRMLRLAVAYTGTTLNLVTG